MLRHVTEIWCDRVGCHELLRVHLLAGASAQRVASALGEHEWLQWIGSPTQDGTGGEITVHFCPACAVEIREGVR